MLTPQQISTLKASAPPTSGVSSFGTATQYQTPEQAKASFSSNPVSTPISNPGDVYHSSMNNPESGSIGKNIANDIQTAGTNVHDAIAGQGQYAGDNPLTRGFEAAGAAASAIPKVAGEFVPQTVKNAAAPIGEAASGIVNWLGEKLGSAQAAQDFVEKHPDAAKTLEQSAKIGSSAGNIAGTALGAGGTAAVAGKVIDSVPSISKIVAKTGNTIKNGINKIDSSVEKANPVSDTLDIVSPKMTAKATAAALAEGRGTGGGLLSRTKIIPDAVTVKTAEAVKGLVQKNAPASKNIANIRQALSTEAESLKSQIAAVDHPYSFKELNAKLNAVETPISIKGTAFEKQIGAVKKAAMDIAKKKGGNISSLLDARKDFDVLVQKEYPNLYDAASAPMKNSITSIRNAMNDFIEENLPDNLSFKESLGKQSLYYNAIDNIAEKAVAETKSTGIGRIGKTIKEHPIVSSALGVEAARKAITGHF